MTAPRVAFFTDCFHEINGVALTSRELQAFAERRGLPFFSLHAGPETSVTTKGSITTMELRRTACGFRLDAGMSFDLLFPRHYARVRSELQRFRPDILHITGPGDCGLLGTILASQLGIPLVASWHTNLHEFAARRAAGRLGFLREPLRRTIASWLERTTFDLAALYYMIPPVLMAPNQELIDLLQRRTGRTVFLMERGVDTILFSPARRTSTLDPFTVGYVGRLSAEKNVRFLHELEQALLAAGRSDFRIMVVGQGSERQWLESHLARGLCTGVLRGETLAEAYANMDVFVFPSRTDTFGNVVQEALASGVPAIVTSGGGAKFLIRDGVTGYIADDLPQVRERVISLMDNPISLHSMRQAARLWACGRSWDRVFEAVYRAYDHRLTHAVSTPARLGVPSTVR